MPQPAPVPATAGRGLKHLAVRDYLTDLVSRELDVGAAIPSERTLCDRFGVSRMTVRQAVDALVAEGVLRREQGRGTFVAPQRMDFEMRLTTFGEEMRSRGMEPDSKVLRTASVPAAGVVAEALDVVPGAPLHHLERVRYADGVPMSVERVWVPEPVLPTLFADGAPVSVYEALRAAGHTPTWGEDTLTASEATDAEAAMLALQGGRAVMRAERRTYADTGPVMYSTACYRGDRYSVWVPLRAPEPVLVPRQGGAR